VANRLHQQVSNSTGTTFAAGELFVYYSSRTDRAVTDSLIVEDSLSFAAADSSGMWSREETISIQIRSALYGLNTSDIRSREEDFPLELPHVVENERSSFVLRGIDVSGWNRELFYQIVSLPPSHVGRFVYPGTNRSLTIGSILDERESFPYGEGVSVDFIPQKDYHNHPCPMRVVNACERLEIEYRVLSMDETGVDILSASDSKSQEFLVINVNSPPKLTGPSSVPSVQRLTQMHASEIVLTGFNVSDMDKDADRVVVNVTTKSGEVCLSSDWWNTSYQNVPCGRYDGCNDLVCWSNQLILSAYPSIINDMLNGMVYSTYSAGQDIVRVEIMDGSCIDFSGETDQSIHKGCYKVSHEVTVMVTDPTMTVLPAEEETETNWDAILIAMSFLTSVIVTAALVLACLVLTGQPPANLECLEDTSKHDSSQLTSEEEV
jgi:hypothetical protein